MGNFYTRLNYSETLKAEILKYKAGDIDNFIRISNLGKGYDGIKAFYAWKIACLYYFLTRLPEKMHDIGYSQSMIIAEYTTLASLDDPEIKKYVNIAMGIRE